MLTNFVLLSSLAIVLCLPNVQGATTTEVLDPVRGEVGEQVELTCPEGKISLSEGRQTTWYRGEFDGENPPKDSDKIYHKESSGEAQGDKFRTDMSVDPTTFTLKLTVQKEDFQTVFSCKSKQGVEKFKFEQTRLDIYLQGEVAITTDPVQPEEHLNVTVTCSIARIYPNVTEDKFHMWWGGNQVSDAEFSEFMNDDHSMRYTLEKSKNLTSEDNGSLVKCTVYPREEGLGEQASANLTLNFTTMGPTTPSSASYGYPGFLLSSSLTLFLAVLVNKLT